MNGGVFASAALQSCAMDVIYLDNNATTRPAPEVVAAMREADEQLWANPSSVHRFGQLVRHRVEQARTSVAKLIGGRDRELVFTSGGTESNNLALRGAIDTLPDDVMLVCSPVEHSAVREPVEAAAESGVDVRWLEVDAAGRVRMDQVDATLTEAAESGRAVVISVQWVNNETGVIQPVEQVGRAVRRSREDHEVRGWFHVDGTQAVGKLPVDAGEAGIDMMTFAAHKFHGPKGVGALWIRTGVRLRRQQLGGPQERQRRGGTENVSSIIGFGRAAELAAAFVRDASVIDRLRTMRDDFERRIVEALPDAVVHAREAPRVWNTSNIGFPHLEAEAILVGLSEKGVCASAGAACSSGSLEPSPILLAMGMDEAVAHGSVRLSISRMTTSEELATASQKVVEVVTRLREVLPV